MLVPCDYSYPSKFARRAIADGVSVKPDARTKWFRIAGVDGFCGLIPTDKNGTKVRIKGVWIAPEFRGQGAGSEVAHDLIEEAKKLGATTIETISRKFKFYERLGFSRVRKMPSATTEKWKMELRL